MPDHNNCMYNSRPRRHELALAIKGDARNFIERQSFKDTRLYIAIDFTLNSIFIAYCLCYLLFILFHLSHICTVAFNIKLNPVNSIHFRKFFSNITIFCLIKHVSYCRRRASLEAYFRRSFCDKENIWRSINVVVRASRNTQETQRISNCIGRAGTELLWRLTSVPYNDLTLRLPVNTHSEAPQ